jgi:predicted nucleic acid-binding protein
MANRFLDTHVLLRYLTKDDPIKAEAALALLIRVEQGLERVDTSPMVIFETVFTLQHRYAMPRDLIRDAITDLISLRGLRLPHKQLFREALDLFATTRLSFADAYNTAYMKLRGLSEIYSWDMDFDRASGITRVEPQV